MFIKWLRFKYKLWVRIFCSCSLLMFTDWLVVDWYDLLLNFIDLWIKEFWLCVIILYAWLTHDVMWWNILTIFSLITFRLSNHGQYCGYIHYSCALQTLASGRYKKIQIDFEVNNVRQSTSYRAYQWKVLSWPSFVKSVIFLFIEKFRACVLRDSTWNQPKKLSIFTS